MNLGPSSALRRYGCSIEAYLKLREIGAVQAFWRQKTHAKVRGIGWELLLWDWWRIWDLSGHWLQRGRRANQYVMARHKDEGPYAAGNVSIITASQNIIDFYRHSSKIRRRSVSTQCCHGHELTPENTRLYRGYSVCRTCHRLEVAKYAMKGKSK